MPMHRKNTDCGAKRQPAAGRFGFAIEGGYETNWFANKRTRERRRKQIAQDSRRKNREG